MARRETFRPASGSRCGKRMASWRFNVCRSEAAKVYLLLAGLQSPGGNTVALSNYLGSAGRRLLLCGAGPQARRLIEIAASYHDGSQRNLQAGVRVALWQKDGELALQRLPI